MANALTSWLEGCGAFDVQPQIIVIGKARYAAARYKQTHTTPQNSPAWLRGEREYTREMIYCVGQLPASYKRSSKTCYRLLGDTRDWFVASFVPAAVASDPKFSAFHPFGEAFQLAPWDADKPIDHYEDKPRTRVGVAWKLAA